MFADTVADEIVSDSQREWGRGADLAVTGGELNAGAGVGKYPIQAREMFSP